MLDRFHHREQLVGLVDLHRMDAHQRDHVVVVLDGADIEEDGDIFDGAALAPATADVRADGRFEDRDGGLFVEDRPGLLATLLDVVRLDVRVVTADPLLVDLAEESPDELRVVGPDERIDRLPADRSVGGTRHEQHRPHGLVGVPGDPRRRGHLRVHARSVELLLDGERLRVLPGVPLRVRALRDPGRFRVELVAPVLAGAPGDCDRSRRCERREQPTSFHAFG